MWQATLIVSSYSVNCVLIIINENNWVILFSNANNGSILTYLVNFNAGQLTVFERWVNRENQSDIFLFEISREL